MFIILALLRPIEGRLSRTASTVEEFTHIGFVLKHEQAVFKKASSGVGWFTEVHGIRETQPPQQWQPL